MPGGDRTGPLGMGSMTGRAAGYCAGYPVPGYMNPSGGRGFGMAGGRGFRGGGRGFRGWYGAPAYGGYPPYPGGAPYAPSFPTAAGYGSPYAPAADPAQELEALKSQAEYFGDALENIKKRIDELESAGTEKEEK